MNRRTLLAGSAVALAGCTDAIEEAAAGPDPEAAATQIRESINQIRATASAVGLQESSTLQEAALRHSRDMAERDFYAHRNPDGEMPWHRVACEASENIHRGQIGEMQNVDSNKVWNTSDTGELAGYVVEGWEESSEHYQNLIDPKWTAIGVGLYIDETQEFFATAMFC